MTKAPIWVIDEIITLLKDDATSTHLDLNKMPDTSLPNVAIESELDLDKLDEIEAWESYKAMADDDGQVELIVDMPTKPKDH